MEFRPTDTAARQVDRADALEFSPATATVASLQVGVLADREIDGDRLDVGNLTNQLEVYTMSLLYHVTRGKESLNSKVHRIRCNRLLDHNICRSSS